ncbi:MAG: PAS domain S-box protein [Bradyrhizobium sp.]|uniref:PAS domain-containing protein n=1 Tax=Bradyrhizobium sp. TaxID=376 RepID=UPI0025C5458D|nr:PAS domain-containing protein [Bradyrhizobium sp.]MBI5265244.1 PAS domain S-box protein [Bradyrhizobium sp.]
MKLPFLTGVERRFGDDEFVVSKTDLKGRITYGNDVFMRVAGYSERELIGKPHSIIRHPAMPRCVFKLMWDTIQKHSEAFFYLLNRAKNGDHYWVFAHVTPEYDGTRNLIGFHSSRRAAEKRALSIIGPIYGTLFAEEDRHANCKEGLEASMEMLCGMIDKRGGDYARFVLGL